jgi:hypothetical protein
MAPASTTGSAAWSMASKLSRLRRGLTPCMPSRDPGRPATTKPRITGHRTRADVVTRNVSRGLVRLEVLPRCCPPDDRVDVPQPGREVEASAV